MTDIWITLIIVSFGVLVFFVAFLFYQLGFKQGFAEGESIGMEAFNTCFNDFSRIYGGKK